MTQQDLGQAINELKYNLRRYRRVITLVAGVAFGLYALETMFYKVEADEQGVVLRFGKRVGLTDSGLHFKLPWPIETVLQVPVTRVQSLEFGFKTLEAGRDTRYMPRGESADDVARMLTGDLNLAHVEWIVQYKISDAGKYLFTLGGHRNQRVAVEDTIIDVSEAVMRRLVGDVSVDEVLTTGRDRIANDAEHEIQGYLDTIDCGITIVTVRLQTVSPPDPVKDSFDAVNRAKQAKDRVLNDARGESNSKLPEARGTRDQKISEAEGYRERVVREATGKANAFLTQLAEYRKAPEVTRRRLYLETIEQVLSEVGDLTIIDQSVGGVLPLLDLNGRSASTLTNGGQR